MPIRHLLLVLFVVGVWGLNFIFLKISLEEVPPLFLCTLRFLLASVPAIFFVKPPVDVQFRWVVAYGLIMFVMQFSFLFMGLYVGMSPGMASLVMQVQLLFSLFFAMFFLGERLTLWELLGSMISFSGIVLIMLQRDNQSPWLGMFFILAAAASWGAGNLITKKINQISHHNKNNRNIFSLLVWGSFVAVAPLFILSLLFEGPSSMAQAYHQLTWRGTSALFYTVYISTLMGYGAWNYLLGRYPVGVVVPFTLLVPIFGIISSALILGEAFETWKLVAALLVISGLALNLVSVYWTGEPEGERAT